MNKTPFYQIKVTGYELLKLIDIDQALHSIITLIMLSTQAELSQTQVNSIRGLLITAQVRKVKTEYKHSDNLLVEIEYIIPE